MSKINFTDYTEKKWAMSAPTKERADSRSKMLGEALRMFEKQTMRGWTPIEALTQIETSFSQIVFIDLLHIIKQKIS